MAEFQHCCITQRIFRINKFVLLLGLLFSQKIVIMTLRMLAVLREIMPDGEAAWSSETECEPKTSEF